jgi:hypothetical protein
MRLPLALAALLLIGLLAGCTTQAPTPSSAATLSASASATAAPLQKPGETSVKETKQLAGEVRTRFDWGGCLDPRMLFVLDPAAAQALLPPGFKAADVTGLLQFTGVVSDSPVPAGRAVGGYDFLACGNDTLTGGPVGFSQVGVLVETPDLGNRTPVEKAAFDLYLLAFHTDSPAWRALALASGFKPGEAPLSTVVSQQSDVGADNHAGSGIVSAPEPLGQATYAVPSVGNPLDFRARYWHVGDNGTFYFDFRLKETVRAGAIPTCTHAPGSAFQKVSGTTTCTTESRFAAVGLGTTVAGTAYWIPGVFPKATS